MSTAVVLKSLIQESKDGEWGKGEPFEDSVKMAVIRGTDFEAVRNGNIDALPIRYIPKRIADRKTLQPNDILLETAGGSKDRPTGRSLFIKSSIIHRSELPLTCASFSRFIRIDPTKADPRYIFWHLQYLYDADYLRPYHTQHTGVARFQYTVFSEREELVIPPLPIQRKIAGILSAYDDLIENNTRRIEILEEMARSIFREWFVNFRFPGHEQVQMVDSELGLIPEGWKLKTLAEFGQVITGKTPSKKIPENFGSYMPFIKTPDMHNNMFCIKVGEYLSEIGVASQRNKTIPPNSLCVSCIGTAGIVAITSVPSQTNQQINSIILQDELNREFLYFALLGLKETINQYGANGATMVNLNKGKFESLRVTSPSKNLLFNFHKATASNFEMIRTLQLKNLNLRQTRDLLLPRLISGEIDVENLDINTGPIAA